jgi:hypothetical protein
LNALVATGGKTATTGKMTAGKTGKGSKAAKA